MPARIQITAVSKPRKTASVLTPLFQPRSHNPRPCQQLIRRYAAKSPPLLTWIWRCVPRFDQKPQLYACEDTTPTCKSQLLQSQALAPVDYGRQSKLTVFQSQASECGSAALMRALRETAKHPAERQPKAEIPPAMTASRLSPSSRPSRRRVIPSNFSWPRYLNLLPTPHEVRPLRTAPPSERLACHPPPRETRWWNSAPTASG
jgi:hypothetical protein